MRTQNTEDGGRDFVTAVGRSLLAARLLVLAAAAGGLVGLAHVPPAAAQDDGETLVDEGLAADRAGEGAGPAASPVKQRTLLDTIKDGGLVGLLIILLSMVSVGFMVEHSLTIRKSVLMPDYVIDELDEMLGQNRIDEAIEACRAPQNQSLVAYVVLAGLERYKGSEFGFAEYKAAVEEAGEDQTGRLYRKTEVLGLIGSIAPMLGLTGTVLGMITAFNTIASSGGMAKPDELAGGIGQALVTTLMGLIVAIPTMIAFSYFRNRIDSIVAEAGKRVEQIMMPLGRRK
jgi:biopolymer transport protein ExbB